MELELNFMLFFKLEDVWLVSFIRSKNLLVFDPEMSSCPFSELNELSNDWLKLPLVFGLIVQVKLPVVSLIL